MDFAFSSEQELLRSSARDYLADRFPIDRVVALVDADPGWDPASWQQLDDMGWLDPDLGMLELAVLAEETGYALYPGPWWSTRGLAGALGAGAGPATVAWAESGALALRPDAAFGTEARDGRLFGHKVLVADGGLASELYVVARNGVYRVAADVPGVSVLPRSTTDRSRRLAEVVLDGAPGERVGDVDLLVGVRRRALALLACEAVGVAQRCLDLAAAHASTREQFGRPIGSYQGVSHRVADTYVALQLARSLAYWAAWCVSSGDDDAPAAVAAAISSAGEAAVLAAENAIQVHGGIGMTWDHPLHRFYKRAQWIAAYDGPASRQRAEIAATLLG